MALGFAFNKAKTLSAAEKYVQQGKLQNAIAEYEKITKLDPKDLTVLNTIGDLYARLGRADQATEHFKKVGDKYAADGFVVKAIAMYKKLTKLGPQSPETLARLAELYTQQGLYNDARSQYMAIADQYLKSNDRENATGILKKMLELDPDNAAMQTKVADLYIKLGKNKEALEIYFTSAQSLHQRGSMEAAGEALAHVLKLDPAYAPALLLRGQIAADSGNSAVAIECLAKIPNLESHPEALRGLLQAYLKTGDFDRADPLLAKVLSANPDLGAITSYAEALLSSDEVGSALDLYARYAHLFLPANGQAFIDALSACVSKARESAPALQTTLTLLQQAGATGSALREVQELLAHAYVQAGELQKALDLYTELAQAEPENPLHQQNVKQIVARMGKDAVTRELSTEEAGQALMVDELEAAPALVQEYSRDLSEAINSALMDSELFSSYNVPDKAIGPLEKTLPKAPNDVRMRQRLASLYARVGRFADAANSCKVLAEVHASAGFEELATQFRESAAKYQQQAGGVPATAPVIEITSQAKASVSSREPVEPIPFRASSVLEFPAPPAPEPSVAELDLSKVKAELVPEPVAASQADADPGEWEEMLTVEAPTEQAAGEATVQEITPEETRDEIVEEARFYLAQGMLSEAHAAIARLEAVSPHHPALADLRAAAVSASSAASNVQIVEEAEQPAIVAEVDLDPGTLAHLEEQEAAAQPQMAAPVPKASAPAPVGETPEEVLGDVVLESATAAQAAAPAKHEAAHANDDPLAGLMSDLEDVLEDIAPPPPVKAAPIAPPRVAPPTAAKPAVAAAATAASAPALDQRVQAEANSMLSDLLDEFKEEIDEPVAEAEDPETHYNLGVAFREMGLLDEAIGELQKVCRALDNGTPFSQPIQAYTWLAQCLVDKGAPQAAIRWYERALHVQGINEDSRMAVRYDMGTALESAGDRKAALDHFMQVYGANIDYRDVAERIRSLSK